MLKTILFLSIIIKLAFGEEDIIDDDEISTVEINMVTLANLSPYVELYNDEIEAEMVKTCLQIKKKKACLQASSKAPVGRVTGRRGNDGKGECMYFKRKNNPIVQALGNQCLPPAPVIKLIQANRPPAITMDDEAEDEDDIDAVEMSEGLFDSLSANAPSNDDVTEDMMKYCKEIKKENVCLRSTSKAPIGRTTYRRGNDGPGECMYFQRKRNSVVQALGNQCLPPQSVINYKQRPAEEDIIDDDDDDDDDDDVEISTVEINMVTLANLSPYVELYNDEIEAEMVKTCKQIKKRKACLQATSKAPVGRTTNSKGNDGPGECMYFRRKRNRVVQALGNQCLPPNEVVKYIQAMQPPAITMDDEDEDENEDDIDAVEMSEGLFDSLSANAPSNDDITEDMMKYCKQIKGERVCMNSESRAPNGKVTGRRGNDGPGECMYFKRSRNPVVQALGNQCLAPQAVINYKQNPPMEHEFFAALGLTNENNELNYNALSMVMIMMVLIGAGAYYKLCKNKKKESILNGERRPSQYQSV